MASKRESVQRRNYFAPHDWFTDNFVSQGQDKKTREGGGSGARKRTKTLTTFFTSMANWLNTQIDRT
jgi:hypothetical protein